MRRKKGMLCGAILAAMVFLLAGTGFCQDDAKVSLKDWTKILESKVAEQVGDKGIVNYEDQYIEVVAIGAPPERYYGKPQARPLCIRAAKVVAMRDILEIVQGVRIDSETMVKDYVVESDTIKAAVNGIVKNVVQVGEPSYMSDGTCEVKYRMSMKGPFMQAILPKAIADDKKTDTPPPKVKVRPTPPGEEVYTGLVVDARGLNARPAMSPKVFDEDGKEVYGSLVVSKEYAVQQGISGYARDLTAAQSNPRVTNNPLTVKAISAEGPGRSDLKISNQDAGKLRGIKENQAFMKQCRVMIVLD
ncbi:MAG TPA: hypothetical protein PK836_00915 [Syntrophales bacterium]|nr:hypothetical protein [Syntrophales bacterium]HOM06435.1 hypothetical protein [Syntrophales bacterium]HON99114.1 hypothetical protein [Syntrophales bacterium]HPC00222.1 hypothetical protein [Syntrophales bacterium]HPQ05885.1 hypothetical protein [Syntrophales bacterium]